MASDKKYFGTDGIRDKVGQGLIRPDQILKLGWALGHVLQGADKTERPSVMIGKDTRVSGYMFESALEAGLIAAGVDVLLLGPMPTPAIAYLTETFHASAGIVISASHNPHHDNGIKFFNHAGQKISDEMELAIEQAFDRPMVMVDSEALGRARRVDDAPGRYIEFCKSTYRAPKKLDGLKLVLDCANGATYHIAPNVFRELGAQVVTIGDQPDGININQACGATDLARLQTCVLESKADLGIAFDGDGDRVMMVDDAGQVVDGDELLYVLASYSETEVEGVVGTVMSNLGLEKALVDRGIAFHRAQVGDRYVMRALNDRGWLFGAENSGHVLCLNRIGTGDGIVAALQVLSVVVQMGQTLARLKAGMKKYPQLMENVRLNASSPDLKQRVKDNEALNTVIEQAQQALGSRGRILIRPSGTEPLIRVMVEGDDVERIEPQLKSLAEVVRTEFS
ncbi:MAG: phosphoglucosamine mutase [Hydrogenovibrio sp.]|uniref:phosphoglucosamine mutase n=1 Tax=Hydrogenovibrio sp. TaxID=2065821 RepID=UPI00286FC3A0|nr:phosphoglucosamine mutase [Hydrogenovibrio sp.]MDR9499440.1 phosphoglucosamine mutase [Hydrogenovibrio sp.]